MRSARQISAIMRPILSISSAEQDRYILHPFRFSSL